VSAECPPPGCPCRRRCRSRNPRPHSLPWTCENRSKSRATLLHWSHYWIMPIVFIIRVPLSLFRPKPARIINNLSCHFHIPVLIFFF
jgi:hypothetical protein